MNLTIKNLTIKIQSHHVTFSAYLLPLVGADIVLGIAWLATLGLRVIDYSNSTMKFYLNSQFVTLHDEKDHSPTTAQFHHLKLLHATNTIVEVYTSQL